MKNKKNLKFTFSFKNCCFSTKTIASINFLVIVKTEAFCGYLFLRIWPKLVRIYMRKNLQQEGNFCIIDDV